MERSFLSKLFDLRDHLATLSLQATVQREITDILEEVESRLYAVEQDRNLLLGQQKAMKDQIASLNARYSEILYALSDRRRG